MKILNFIKTLDRKRVIIILVVLNLLGVGIGVSYSTYKSSNTNNVEVGSIAKIVFNNQVTQTLSLPSYGLVPGNSADYLFKVSNYNNGVRSDVNIDYSIRIETFHFIPTIMKLYRVSGGNNTLVLTCDENNGTRNDENKLVCTSSISTLLYSSDAEDNYKIVIEFPSTDSVGNSWGSDYSEVIDYVDISVISNQKTD